MAANPSVWSTQVDNGIPMLSSVQVAAFGPYPNIAKLLKDMPAPQGAVQGDAGKSFKSMLQNGGLGIDPNVARPLDNALVQDPNLHNEILKLWNEHPEQLAAAIPTIGKNPSNAIAIVDAAYNQTYSVASAPAAAAHAPSAAASHSAPQKTAATKSTAAPPAPNVPPSATLPAAAASASAVGAKAAPNAGTIASAAAASVGAPSAPPADGTANPMGGIVGALMSIVQLLFNPQVLSELGNVFGALSNSGGFGGFLNATMQGFQQNGIGGALMGGLQNLASNKDQGVRAAFGQAMGDPNVIALATNAMQLIPGATVNVPDANAQAANAQPDQPAAAPDANTADMNGYQAKHAPRANAPTPNAANSPQQQPAAAQPVVVTVKPAAAPAAQTAQNSAPPKAPPKAPALPALS